MSKSGSEVAAPPTTWVVLRDDDEFSLDSAAAIARAPRSGLWSWLTLDGGRRVADTVRWLRPDATVLENGHPFAGEIAAAPPPAHIVASRDAVAPVRDLVRHLHREGRAAPTVERASTVVGPDGAPLWRATGVRSVDVLRESGYEPEAVVAFLAPEPPRLAVYLDVARLARLNRDVVRAMAPDRRLGRIRAELPPALSTRDDVFLNDLWLSLRPRLDVFCQVSELLAYLSEGWTVPELSEVQADEVAGFLGDLRASPPITGREAVERLDRLGEQSGEIARRRRLIRWAITGQSFAPSLEAVWGQLGTETAISRLEAAVEGVR